MTNISFFLLLHDYKYIILCYLLWYKLSNKISVVFGLFATKAY